MFLAVPVNVRQTVFRTLLQHPNVDGITADLLVNRLELFSSTDLVTQESTTGFTILADARMAASAINDAVRARRLDDILIQVYRTRMTGLKGMLVEQEERQGGYVPPDEPEHVRIIELREETRHYLDQAYNRYGDLEGRPVVLGVLPGNMFLDLLQDDPMLYDQRQLIDFFLDHSTRFWLRTHLPWERLR